MGWCMLVPSEKIGSALRLLKESVGKQELSKAACAVGLGPMYRLRIGGRASHIFPDTTPDIQPVSLMSCCQRLGLGFPRPLCLKWCGRG